MYSLIHSFHDFLAKIAFWVSMCHVGQMSSLSSADPGVWVYLYINE